jgi:hypothetical protein
MSQSIDQAFIKQYEGEVHAAYQRMGSTLRNFVRVSTKTPGADITFQKVGKGVAGQKTRNGDVPLMNVDHTNVTCTLADYYAGDYVDKLDQLKTNIDERKVTVEAGAYALGRKTDELIVAKLDSATGGGAGSANLSTLTVDDLIAMVTNLGGRDVPMDGNVYACVTWKVWGKMLKFQEFANSQWVGPDALPFKTNLAAKYWMGALWTPFSGLTVASNVSKNYAFHRSAIGHGIGSEIISDVTWQGTKASWFVNNMMSQGAVLIDDNGVERLSVTENA